MIDTDKYEVRAYGKWSVGHEGQHDLPEGDIPINVNGGLTAIAYSQADAQLIADSPLLLAEVKRLRKEINQLPIDLHESLDMILEAHYPEVRESVMSMFGDAWGNNLTGYEE